MATVAQSKSPSAASQHADTGSAASQRAATLALPELNQRSAGLGLWDVGIFRPAIHEYKWVAKSTGAEKTGADFRCILVSISDPSQYVSARLSMRSNNMAPLKQAETKFQPDLKFRISKVVLDSSAKQEYLHTPIKLKIDLTKTKADPLLQDKQGERVQPVPSMSIKDCKMLQQSQRFDVMALVDTLSDARAVTTTRQAISVTLIDDSGDDGKPGQLTVAFFMNLPLSTEDTATMNILREAVASKEKPVFSFFALQGKQGSTGYTFEADSAKDFFLVKAVGPRADALAQVATSLQSVPQEMRDVLQQSSVEHRDYASETGAQTLCKLLADLAVTTDVQKLNEKPTLWQANWVEVEWPRGETLLRKDGSALWFQTSLRDISGQVANVWMNEKTALSLSQLDDKEAFVESFEQGRQLFPIMSSVKVIREVRSSQDTGGVSQPADATKANQVVNLVVVHGEDQPWSEAPTKAALEMIPLIRDLKDDTSAILPAGLHMLETSPHYAFRVACNQVILPCQKILALVRSSKNSTPSPLGTGFKLITPGIEDLLSTEDPSGQAQHKKHTLSAICTMSNLPQYRLDAPRGGTQDALVTVTARTDDSFVVESVQLLSSDEAAKVKHSLLQLLHLAIHIHGRDRKRAVDWSDEISPITFRKCSRVGRCPTDAPLPDP